MKPLTDAQYALKAAVRRAVMLCGGPNAAAEIVRADAPRLSRYGNPDCPEFAPIDVCLELDRAAGANVILRAMADLCDLEVSQRNVDRDAAYDLTHAAGQVAKESGELISATIEASADGKVTPREAREIDEAAAELQEKVISIRTAARRNMVAR